MSALCSQPPACGRENRPRTINDGGGASHRPNNHGPADGAHIEGVVMGLVLAKALRTKVIQLLFCCGWIRVDQSGRTVSDVPRYERVSPPGGFAFHRYRGAGRTCGKLTMEAGDAERRAREAEERRRRREDLEPDRGDAGSVEDENARGESCAQLGAGARRRRAGAPSRGASMMAVTVPPESEVGRCSMTLLSSAEITISM